MAGSQGGRDHGWAVGAPKSSPRPMGRFWRHVRNVFRPSSVLEQKGDSMSLVGTLAKVAIGVAAAKGIGYMVNKRGSGGPGTGASPDDGGLFGGAPTGPGAAATGQPSLQDMLGSILGGGA